MSTVSSRYHFFLSDYFSSKKNNVCDFFTFVIYLFFLYYASSELTATVKTLNIGTPRPATVVVLNIKQFNFTMK